jgi:hypothetical protein
LSDDCSNSNFEALSRLVGKDKLSFCPGSDGSGSRVEGPPLLDVFRVVVPYSQSLLISTNVLVPEDGSFMGHSGFDLELHSVLQRLSWVFLSFLVNGPSLVLSVVTCPPGEVIVMVVSTTPGIEAQVGVLPDVPF